MFPAVFNLADLNGKNGFVIEGGNSSDASGYSVSGAGDINGDGVADVIIGTSGSEAKLGESYVVFGSKSGFTTPFNLTNLNGNNGFAINGINRGYKNSLSVSGAGDINSDGIADIVIGAPNANNYAGQIYVIFGSKIGFTTPFNLADLNGVNGFTIYGINNDDFTGFSVSGAGDINDDSIADIIISAPKSTNYGAGESYVIFGSKRGFTTPFNLADLNGDNGFFINGVYGGNNIGFSVSKAGDINSDGIADLVIGTTTCTDYNLAASYVIFGSKSGFSTPFNLAGLNGVNGFVINGITQDNESGFSVSGTGDINGDGIDDMVIGAPNANNYAGQSYVIFGSKKGFTTPFNLANLNGTNGFFINGITQDDQSGFSVSGAADINGDGVADVIISAPIAGNKGQSYIIFGSKSGFTTPFNLADLNGVNGFTIKGINVADGSGSSVSGAGDVNADGIDDVIIGSEVGQSYVIFGNDNNSPVPTPTPTHLPTVTPSSTKTPEPGVTASSTPTSSTSFGASHTSTQTPSPNFNPHHENPNSDNHEGLSAGAIAGIVIGGVVGLGAVIGTVWWHCHKYVSVSGETPQYAELETGIINS